MVDKQVRDLVEVLVERISSREREDLKAIGDRLSEIHSVMESMARSMEKIAFIMPIQQTAHLAMEALIKSMKGPHEAPEIAKVALSIAEEMHSELQTTLLKFAEKQPREPESVDAEAQERRDTERPSPNGNVHSHDSPAI